MTEVRENRVEVAPGETVVERKILPAHRISPLAVIIWIAFVAICVVVFGGYRLGLRTPTPLEQAAENMPHEQTPAAP
jgi:hypothetical protein